MVDWKSLSRKFDRPMAGTSSLAAALLGAAIAFANAPAQAQQQQWQPQSPQYVQCPAKEQPLLRIPELVSHDGLLRGTVLLTDGQTRMYLGAKDQSQCLLQTIRQFRGIGAVLPEYPGTIPFGFPDYKPPPSFSGNPPFGSYQDPVPGPTLRARVGDIVQLTFLNQINSSVSWNTVDRGEKGQGCDTGFSQSNSQPQQVYPGNDQFPDCFHGSTTGNIHYHGTHTSPSTTADDVFIEVRPSLRDANGPIVTEASVRDAFDKFFAECTLELKKSAHSQWPKSWGDLPPAYVAQQLSLLAQYDSDPVIKNKLLPVDLQQWSIGAWPQYYIGAFPYCFSLPEYKEKTWPPGPAHPSTHGMPMEAPEPPLLMGQAPGTHWYHAHKHGSTALNVENGMTGAFIIEGGYDDALNDFYGKLWTRTQPVLVINQLGTGVNLFGGGTPRSFSVNGRVQPTVTMKKGEVQLWRIVNTSARGGVFSAGFAAHNATVPLSPQIFTWKQIAQDGVQFDGPNYENNKNRDLFIAPGNRVDLLVQAPKTPGQYVLLAVEVRSRCQALPANQIPTIPTPPTPTQPNGTPICGPGTLSALLTVIVTETDASGNQSQFIPSDRVQAAFPPFLQDIGDEEVKGTKTIVFDSEPTSPFVTHTIDGHTFDGNIGAVVTLNTVEEWKIVNKTVNGGLKTNSDGTKTVVATSTPGVVDHPFHIHINPFQIVDFFDPNQVLPGTNTYKYVFIQSGQQPPPLQPGQCLLYYDKPDSWKPCEPLPKTHLIWWDVFAIPSARAVFFNGNMQYVVVPGYFAMRSRFVDYVGQYVMHCHILAHEDRGMMTVVEVVPFTTPYSHR